jgi:hypothetical protein
MFAINTLYFLYTFSDCFKFYQYIDNIDNNFCETNCSNGILIIFFQSVRYCVIYRMYIVYSNLFDLDNHRLTYNSISTHLVTYEKMEKLLCWWNIQTDSPVNLKVLICWRITCRIFSAFQLVSVDH